MVISDPPSFPSWVVSILCIAILTAFLLVTTVVRRYLHKRSMEKKIDVISNAGIKMVSDVPYVSLDQTFRTI